MLHDFKVTSLGLQLIAAKVTSFGRTCSKTYPWGLGVRGGDGTKIVVTLNEEAFQVVELENLEEMVNLRGIQKFVRGENWMAIW